MFTERFRAYSSFKNCEIEGSNEPVGDSLQFNITACGRYNLSFSGKAHNDKGFHSLGSVHVDLPQHMDLVQEAEGMTWARLAFEKRTLRNCRQHPGYTIKCGSLTHYHVRLNDSIVIDNLLPGQNYSCKYGNKGLEKKVDFSSRSFLDPHTSDLSFSTHDTGIFLIHDQVDDLLANPNLTVALVVTDLRTNQTFEASGQDAVNKGVTGLRPASQYKGCLTLAQVEGTCTFDCKNDAWCHYLATQPSPAWNSSSKGLFAAAFLFVGLLGIAGIVMFALVWMRLNVSGAPSVRQAWTQIKKGKDNCAPFANDLIMVETGTRDT